VADQLIFHAKISRPQAHSDDPSWSRWAKASTDCTRWPGGVGRLDRRSGHRAGSTRATHSLTPCALRASNWSSLEGGVNQLDRPVALTTEAIARIGNERLGRAGMSVDLSNIPIHDQNLVFARMWHLHAERAD
jgi:hypothetical protein